MDRLSGVSARVPAHGAAAVRQTTRLRPDVVLLDVHLPDMDGFEVARRLDDERSIVVLISSREQDDFGDRIRTSSARGFLAKVDLSGHALEAVISDRT